jgi:hypothetical protein
MIKTLMLVCFFVSCSFAFEKDLINEGVYQRYSGAIMAVISFGGIIYGTQDLIKNLGNLKPATWGILSFSLPVLGLGIYKNHIGVKVGFQTGEFTN